MPQASQPKASTAELSAFFAQHGIRDVECIFADITGYPRGKLVPAAGSGPEHAMRPRA